MRILIGFFRELAGLFIDDGMLALSLIAIVGFAALVTWIAPTAPLAAGVVLVFGCPAALLHNVTRAAKRSPPRSDA